MYFIHYAYGFMSILLLPSMMQSSGGVSRISKIFLFIFLGLVLHVFHIGFLLQYLVHLVVIFGL